MMPRFYRGAEFGEVKPVIGCPVQTPLVKVEIVNVYVRYHRGPRKS